MPEKTSITEVALQLLNQLQESDPTACADLVSHKTPVADAIADHKDFICQQVRGGKVNLSVLGLINSVLVKSGEPKLAAIIDDDGTVVGFTKRVATPTVSVPPSPPSTKN